MNIPIRKWDTIKEPKYHITFSSKSKKKRNFCLVQRQCACSPSKQINYWWRFKDNVLANQADQIITRYDYKYKTESHFIPYHSTSHFIPILNHQDQMALFSALFNCFESSSSLSSSSSRVSDRVESTDSDQKKKMASNEMKKSNSKSSKSSKAPIVVSYFPVNSYPSRL